MKLHVSIILVALSALTIQTVAFREYSDRSEFDADAPGLPVEDFEGSFAPQDGFCVEDDGVLSSSQTTCYPPGELLDGFELVASFGGIIVASFRSTRVSTNNQKATASLKFTNTETFAVGFDVNFIPFDDVTSIEIYGLEDRLIGVATVMQGGFLGVISDEPIVEMILGAIRVDNLAFGNFVVDTDGDGIPDGQDECIDSNLSATIAFGDCDSGVENTLNEVGCTLADLLALTCPDPTDDTNHGEYVSCVTATTNAFKKVGDISGSDKGAIQSCAAQYFPSN